MREIAPRRPPPPANDNAGEDGPRRAPEVRHDPAPLGAVWVDTEIADDATVIEPGGGEHAAVAVSWS